MSGDVTIGYAVLDDSNRVVAQAETIDSEELVRAWMRGGRIARVVARWHTSEEWQAVQNASVALQRRPRKASA